MTARRTQRRWWRRRRAAARRLVIGSAVAAAAVLLTATAASAAAPGVYQQNGQPGKFTQLGTGNIVHGEVDDALFGFSTSGSGLGRLPFPIHAYNQTYQNVVVSSNGNVQLGLTVLQASAAFVNECLPTSLSGHPIVMPYWDDLFFGRPGDNPGFPDGIFVKTAGTAPHRTFTISWQGRENATGNPVEAEVVFPEGSQTIRFFYGRAGGASATIGVQSKEQLSWSQFSCDSGSGTTVVKNLQIAWMHENVM